MIPTHSLTQKRYGTTIVSLRDGNILFLEDKLESQFCDWVIPRGEIQISAGQRCLKAGIVGAPSLSNKSMKQLFLLITWVCSGKRLTSPQDAAILAVYRSNLWRGNSPLRHGAHGNKFEATVRAATFFQDRNICYSSGCSSSFKLPSPKENLPRLSTVTSAVAMCCYGDKEIDGEGKFLVTALPNSRNRRCRLVLAVLLTALPK